VSNQIHLVEVLRGKQAPKIFQEKIKEFFANLRKQNNSCRPGLPDGLFSNQKSQFGYIL
jgi:hypothetical protein